MRYLFSLIIILFSLSTLSAQSPWTQDKGSGFAQLSLMTIPGYSDFALAGNLNRPATRVYTEYGVQLYGEYGLIDGTTLVGSIPLKYLQAGAAVDSLTPVTAEGDFLSTGNFRLAVKQRIYNEGLAVAGQFGIEAPTGASQAATGLRTSFQSWTFTPSLSVGSGFGKGYVYGYGGVAFRTNDYSHYFTGGLEGGYKVFKPLWAMLYMNVNRSFWNSTRLETPQHIDSGFYVNDQEWITLSLKLLFEINDNLGLTTSTTLIGFAANQVPLSPSLTLGFYGKWDQKKEKPPIE